jgi:peptidoglycan/xylan/chitin deacetylase (PgdA/CDA1 family)
VRRHKLIFGILAAAVAVAIPAEASSAGDRSRPQAGPTVISLEFDHAFSDQLPAIELANRLGLKVTVFAMSGRIAQPTYMTLAQLRRVQGSGNEIGGHTIDHADLSQLPAAAQRHEICDDRTALRLAGLDVTDFAYPYGHYNGATPRIVRSCGYRSARGTGGLASPGGCYGPCPPVESIPPADRWVTRTVNSVLRTTSLATIKHYVTRAQRVGRGWVQIVFHYVCDRCDTYAISPRTFSAFVRWLAARRSRTLRVETVRHVINTSARVRASLLTRRRRPGSRR